MKVYIVIDVYKREDEFVEDFDNSIETTRVFSSYDKAYEYVLELMVGAYEDKINNRFDPKQNGWMFTYEDGSGNFYIIERELE